MVFSRVFSIVVVASGLSFLVACSMNLTRSKASLGPGDEPGGDGDNPDTPLTAALYFSETVKPLFESRCITCHTPPRDGGDGPFLIYIYTLARERLLSSGAVESSELMRWMRAQAPHPGGDVCQGNSNNSPCFEVKLWWAKEVVASGGTREASPLGEVTLFSNRGVVTGWAIDTDTEESPIDVEFYADGAKGIGTFLGKGTANVQNPPTGFRGNHGFSFTIPAQFRNGVRHTLFAYGVDSKTGTVTELSKSQQAFQMYSMKAQTYYDTTVRPALVTGCNASNCHTGSAFLNYESALYDYILNPSPAAGGGGMANVLYRKGSNLISHGGGNRCNGGSPCTQIAEWYTREINGQ